MNRSIVVVGSINLDLVCNTDRIPAPGETVSGGQFQTFHGGKGANQAVAAARLAGNVTMIGKVGDDTFGTDLREALRSAAIHTEHVTTVPGASGVALISVDRHGQNSIIVVPGANAHLLPADLEACLPILQSAGILLTQLETPMESVEFLCAFAARTGVPLMLDPAPARELPASALRGVTYLTPNETETATLCRLTTDHLDDLAMTDAAESLLASGPANVILKLGARGSFLATKAGQRTLIPAFRVPVVDSTAAGDAFNGGTAAALMRGLSLEDAVRYGSAVAALSVTRAGAQPAMPTAEQVDAFLAQQPPR